MQALETFSQSRGILNPHSINDVIERKLNNAPIITANTQIQYYNVPMSFDIEVSSFYETISGQPEKRSTMYAWMLGVNGDVILGRTWESFIQCMNTLTDKLNLGEKRRLIIYVHNLSYEFQWLSRLFKWDKVFALDERKPAYARTVNGIEFRCSYILSGYSLAKIGDELKKYPVKKMTGDLNYNLVRHSGTPLTDKEIGYCENDARVVMSYIQERIEEDGDITRIPLTKTGYVRNYCKRACLYGFGSRKSPEALNKYYRYREIMNRLTLTPEEYAELKEAFQGGMCHASLWKSGKLICNVDSFDYCSSYPAVMVSEKFPMSKGERIVIKSEQEFYDNLKYYCCLFRARFYDFQEKVPYEHFLSASKCRNIKGETLDNGRVISCDYVETTITDIDFDIIDKFYQWDRMEVYDFIRYRRGYLPRDFVRAILKFYGDKTSLKGVDGKEIEYAKNKEMVNSCYGMIVTDIVRDMITYTEEWGTDKPDIIKSINKYNQSKTRFLFYPWGIWVTAYARKNLSSGILEFKDDYIYSDTDSIKGRNGEKHMDYINAYNKMIDDKLDSALTFHGFPLDWKCPKTNKGVKKYLGHWEYEGRYQLFKTLGAKRYATYKDKQFSITVSGLNKKITAPYLMEKAGGVLGAFRLFSEGMYIPTGKTGKNTHTYIDTPMHGKIKDYMGNVSEYSELSGIHIEAADYSLSLGREYHDLLYAIKTQYE